MPVVLTTTPGTEAWIETLKIETLKIDLLRLNTQYRARVRTEVAAATKLLATNLREEFQTHAGGSMAHFEPDPIGNAKTPNVSSPYYNGKVRTLSTMRVSAGAMTGRITIGGGAPYVEYGFAPHVIYATNKALHWSDESGEHFAVSTANPGYAGDPFVERAISRTRDEVQSSLAYKIAGHTFSALAIRRNALANAAEVTNFSKALGASGSDAVLAGQDAFIAGNVGGAA